MTPETLDPTRPPRGGVRRMLISALLPLVLGLAGAACGSERAEKPLEEPRGEARRVVTAAVTTLEPATASASGTVWPRQRAVLTARLAAAVHALPVDEGAPVGEGDVVVRLDAAALRAALAAAEAQRGAAVADAQRYARLLGRDAATPREAEAAAARAAGASAAVAAARDALAYAELRAPFAGTLARRLVREGDVVTPGQPLVELHGDGGWELRATVTGAEAAGLTPGQRLRANVDGAGELAATLRSLSPAGDPGTHRFEAVADLEPAPALRSGQFARLRLPPVAGDGQATALAGSATAGELAVPAAALFSRGGLTGVFVVEGGVARLRWVAVGAPRDGLVAVRSGLAAGERVVLAPAGLADGAPVAAALRAGDAADGAPVAAAPAAIGSVGRTAPPPGAPAPEPAP